MPQEETDVPISSASLRLSVQRALLDAIGPSVIAICTGASGNKITITAYIEGLASEEQREALSIAETEVVADFWPEFHVSV